MIVMQCLDQIFILAGIGYETALNLAKRGAKIIITGTNLNDLNNAQKSIIKESNNENIIAISLNLNSLDSVRQFVKNFLEKEPRLDVLINNAGTFGMGRQLTKDQILPTLQINYIGPFLLTTLLLDLLKSSAPSRIVNVGSFASNLSFCFDPNDITKVKYFKFDAAYQFFEYVNTKILMMSLTIELAKMLKSSNVTVNYVHPGVIYTKLYQNKFWSNMIAYLGKYFVMKTVKEGAETTIHAAVCEKVEGVTGKYFIDCKESRLCVNLSSSVREKVWEQTVRLSGLKPNEIPLELQK